MIQTLFFKEQLERFDKQLDMDLDMVFETPLVVVKWKQIFLFFLPFLIVKTKANSER